MFAEKITPENRRDCHHAANQKILDRSISFLQLDMYVSRRPDSEATLS